MEPSPRPSERALRFPFEPGERLYTDHLGRRIVADVEGRGIALVRSPGDALVEADGVPGEGGEVRFQHSLQVSAPEEVSARVEVALGRQELPTGNPEAVALPFGGSGWLLACSGPVLVDSNREEIQIEDGSVPVPFFVGLQGTGRARIIRGNSHWELLDRFGIEDKEALVARSFQVQNLSDVTLLSSRFADGTAHEGMQASHLNAASWDLAIPEDCQGLVVRKLYDRFHGRQRARVFLGNRFVGWWYEPFEDRQRRWAWGQFGIDPEHLQGLQGQTVRITIDPPPGTPLWSVSAIEIWSTKAS